MPVLFGDIVNPVATLIASFAGAWFAFIYQNRQKESEESRQNIAAGNRALVTLFQQANSLKLYQLDRIEPHRNNPGRHIQIQPTLPYQEDSLTFDIKSLDFLLTPKYVQVVLDLILEEARYIEAIKANKKAQGQVLPFAFSKRQDLTPQFLNFSALLSAFVPFSAFPRFWGQATTYLAWLSGKR